MNFVYFVPLLRLRQILETEGPLGMVTSAFYFTLKALFVPDFLDM